MKTAQEKIAKRRADMPRAYRKNYDLAMSGRSRRAAMRAQCLECVQWHREYVRLCTSVECPLYPYRAYCDPQDTSEGEDIDAESPIAENPDCDTHVGEIDDSGQ